MFGEYGSEYSLKKQKSPGFNVGRGCWCWRSEQFRLWCFLPESSSSTRKGTCWTCTARRDLWNLSSSITVRVAQCQHLNLQPSLAGSSLSAPKEAVRSFWPKNWGKPTSLTLRWSWWTKVGLVLGAVCQAENPAFASTILALKAPPPYMSIGIPVNPLQRGSFARVNAG